MRWRNAGRGIAGGAEGRRAGYEPRTGEAASPRERVNGGRAGFEPCDHNFVLISYLVSLKSLAHILTDTISAGLEFRLIYSLQVIRLSRDPGPDSVLLPFDHVLHKTPAATRNTKERLGKRLGQTTYGSAARGIVINADRKAYKMTWGFPLVLKGTASK